MFKYFFSCKEIINNNIKSYGNKNSVLPILISCLLYKNNFIFFNFCFIDDVKSIFKIFSYLGIKVLLIKNIAYIFKNFIKKEILYFYYVEKIRVSTFLISILLKKYKCIGIMFPGGCNLNKRLIDLHLFFFNLNFVKFDFFKNKLNCYFYYKIFKSFVVKFKKYSVGATQNFLIFSTFLKGVSIAKNISTEPETIELCKFLCFLGNRIIGKESKSVKIIGNFNIKNNLIKFFFSSDRIESFTKLSFFLKKIKFCFFLNYSSNNFYSFIFSFISNNFIIKIFKKENFFFIFFIFNNNFTIMNSVFDIFPSLSTDFQPIISSICIFSLNNVFISDNIFLNRHSYLKELFNNGVDYLKFKNFLIIKGIRKTENNKFKSLDLRSAAALLISFFSIKGISCVLDFSFLNRGYSNIYNNIKKTFFKIYKL